MKDAYRYSVLVYEDALHRRPVKHQHGGTTITTDGAEELGRAEVLAREYPGGWVYIHVEYRGKRRGGGASGGVDLVGLVRTG